MLEIDGYRALAAVAIIVIHAWMQGGWLWQGQNATTYVLRGMDAAVALFFALSGLVTFMPMVRGALTGKIPNGKDFFVRRLYRILPLYFFLVLVVWSSRYAGTAADWHDLLRHLTFTQVYDRDHIFWLDGPSWSLADEMHFYILISLLGPPLARFAARRETTLKRLATMALLPAVLWISSLIYTTVVYYALHVSFNSSFTYYNPLARADSFAEGLLLAVILCAPGVMKARPKLATALSAVGIGSLGVLWVIRWRYPALNVYYFTLAGLSSLCLLTGAAMLAPRQRLGRFLRSRPLQLWAVVGFSLYLWHEPVMIQLVKWHILYFRDPVAWPLATIGLIVSATVVAWLSYRLIEQPGVRLQKLLADLRKRQRSGHRARSGPAPRWLPDLTLATPAGTPVVLRDLLKDRPALFALGTAGQRILAEHRFRLDAGEATGIYVSGSAEDGRAPAGTTMLIDPEQRLATAMNVGPALVEVSPGGYITAMH
jgi:peptidoglycan/LPS O-acetylase OafA/YrhL